MRAEPTEDLFYQDKYDENKYIDAQFSDIYIEAKGGDGTLLKAINKYRHLDKPFMGIAGGTENFLMNDSDIVSDSAVFKKFDLIKVKVTYTKSVRDMASIFDKEIEATEEFQAFNDIMLGGDMNAFVSFNVHDKDKIIGKFKGGGIIISTAQGSTGINKSNGGVILPLSSDQWVVTGDKCLRKVHHVIEPSRTSITCESRTPVTLWVDGQNHIISNVSKIEVSKGNQVTVIFNDYDSFKKKRSI